jgi:poly(ADP-ribose) glycohydrolase ARH3
MTSQTSIESKFLGGLIGSALGDAIGELAFTHRNEDALRAQVARSETLTYTDDTAMSIGLAESILQTGEIDQQHLGDTFRANFQREPWRGYAPGPPTVFAIVERLGVLYTEAAQSLFHGAGSFGNGAAMRVTPVGLLFHDSPTLYEHVQLSATVTHAHPFGVDGAAIIARAIAQVVELEPQEPLPRDRFIAALLDFSRTREMWDKLTLVRDLLEEDTLPMIAAVRLRQGVTAHESVPFAIYAFLCYPHSFEECLFCAALNGGDRDTLAAMACAISGAYLGIEALPQSWREKIENRQHIEDLAVELLKSRQIGND